LRELASCLGESLHRDPTALDEDLRALLILQTLEGLRLFRPQDPALHQERDHPLVVKRGRDTEDHAAVETDPLLDAAAPEDQGAISFVKIEIPDQFGERRG